MKEKMKKFGAWLMVAYHTTAGRRVAAAMVCALAFAGAANAADYTAASQDEFLNVAAKAVSGDRILLGEGAFTIGPVDIDGKTLTFKGAGETLTTVYIGNGGYDGNGGHGSNKAAKMTFEELTLDDLASDSGYLTGFTEAAGLTFRKVTFNVGFSNWGNKGGAVNFYDCTFNPVAVGKYNVQELRSASGTQFLFDGCVFNSAEGRFINAYKQGGTEAFIDIVVKDCTFKNTGSVGGKCALNLHDSVNGCTIALTFVGENKTEGAFPTLDESTKSTKPSKLFQTEGAGHATVMFKATEEDDPVVIYASNWKIPDRWIDPDGYTLPGVAAEVEVVVPTVSEETGITQQIVDQIAANPEVAKVEDTGLKAALAEDETLKDAEAVVKVELTKAAKDESGVLTFEIKPVVKGETETDISDKVVGKPITFRVPLTDAFTKFAKVTHKGTVDEISHVEVLGAEGSRYVELTFNHFSEVEFDPELSFPGLPETAVKVADGFYQSAPTYTASTDFYITSKVGLEYFRDLVNGKDVLDAYIASDLGKSLSRSDMRFSGKTVKLLADINLNNEIWEPISAKSDKDVFCGTFDGGNHVISNLKVVYEGSTSKAGAGLFGYIKNAVTIQNVTIDNADISGFDCVGGVVGISSSSDTVIRNCKLTGSVSITSRSSFVGGIIGHTYAKEISGCSVEATGGTGIYCGGTGIRVGGICGYNLNPAAVFEDCHVKNVDIAINHRYLVGGIVGTACFGNKVVNCSVENVNVSCNYSPNFGLLVGKFDGGSGLAIVEGCTAVNSTATGKIEEGNDGTKFNCTDLVGRTGTAGTAGVPADNLVVGSDIVYDTETGLIKGGTFDVLPESAVAEGFEGKADPETGKIIVEEKKSYVAMIGEKGYETLKAAFDDVTGGETVTLLANCALDASTSIPGKDVTITAVDPSISLTLKTGGYGGSGANVTFKDMKLIGVAQSSGSQYTTGLIGVKKETYENCTMIGPFCTYGAASFTGCVFKSVDYEGDEENLAAMPAPSPYTKMQSLWVYVGNCLVTVDHCKFLTYDRAVKIFGDEPKTFNVRFTNTDFYCQKKNKAAIMVGVDHLKETNIIIDEKTVIAHPQYSDGVEGGYALVYSEYGELNGGTSETAYLAAHPEAAVRGQYAVGENIVLDESGKITAGTFSRLVGEALVAEGFEGKADPETGKIVVEAKPAYVAMIGEKGYETLNAAIQAAAAMDQTEEKVIELQSCEITESIKLPATLKNVTFRGQEDGKSVLKDMTINSSDGSEYTYENIWFDGVVFENSRMIITGGRTGIEVNKNWKFTGNTFRNLTQQDYSYLHFASLTPDEPAENFTFTGNVVDGSTFASAAALNISGVTGTIEFKDNDIKNLLWRPMNIQINNHDGVADVLTVTGNKFGINGSSPQMLTIFADGYDSLTARINQNIFGGNIATGFILAIDNPETLDGDVTHNYYSSATTRIYLPDAYVYFDSDAAADLPHASHDCFSYYTGLTEDGKIDPATLVEVKKAAVAKIVETGKEYPTLQAAFEAAGTAKNVTIELLSDVDLKDVEWPVVNFNGTFDGKGYTISNLKVAYVQDHSGFIHYSDGGAVVKNVTFKDASITGDRASVVIGYGYGCTAENVTVEDAVITGVQKCGGIIGLVGEGAPLTMTGCTVENLKFVYADLETDGNGGTSFGGLAGFVQYGVNAVITDNKVSGISFVGALDEATFEEYYGSIKDNEKYYQLTCHPFIAAVMGTVDQGVTTPVSVTLADNEVEQVTGLLIGPTTTEYMGFYYREGWTTRRVVDITVDGVLMPNRAVAQIGEEKFYSINDAFAAVNSQEGTGEVTIKILRDVKEALKDDYGFDRDVVVDSDVEGGVTLDFVSISEEWAIGYPSKKLTFTENVKILNLFQLFGLEGTYLYGDAELYQLWAFCGNVNIMPSSKVKMLTEMIKLRYNGTLNVTGTGVGYDSENKQLWGGYVWADYTLQKAMNLKDTYVELAHVGVDDSKGAGAFDLTLDNATLELGDDTGVTYGSAGGTISLKSGSLIIAGAIKNVTTITIDGASYGTEPVKVIDYTGKGTMTLEDYGNVVVTGESTAYVEDNDLWVRAKTYVAQIASTGEKYETLEAAAEAAAQIATVEERVTIQLLSDIDFSQKYEKGAGQVIDLDNVTLDLDGHEISANNFGVVYQGDNMTIKNGTFTGANNASYAIFVGDERMTTGVVLDALTCTGGINVYKAKVTIKSTCATGVSGTSYYAVWADEAADITIEDGSFATPNEGGNPALAASAKANGLIVKGGIYSTDPTTYVANGYEVVANTDSQTSASHPFKVQKKTEEEIEIPVDDSGEAVIPVKVPEGVFEQEGEQKIVDKDGKAIPTPTTTEQKQQFLVTEQPNGLKVWQNVAMGVDGNTAVNALATISREPTEAEKAKAAEAGKTVDIVINTPITEFDPPTTTGVTVSYKLLRSTDGGVIWTVVAEKLEKPEFPACTQDDTLISAGDTFWKFQAVFESQANAQAE